MNAGYLTPVKALIARAIIGLFAPTKAINPNSLSPETIYLLQAAPPK